MVLDLVAPIVYLLIDQEAERIEPEAGLDYKLQWASTEPKSQVSKGFPTSQNSATSWESSAQKHTLGRPSITQTITSTHKA